MAVAVDANDLGLITTACPGQVSSLGIVSETAGPLPGMSPTAHGLA